MVMFDRAPSRSFSRRLRDALVADLVLSDNTTSTDRDAVPSPRDEEECVSDLARQLGITLKYAGTYATLAFVLVELEELAPGLLCATQARVDRSRTTPPSI